MNNTPQPINNTGGYHCTGVDGYDGIYGTSYNMSFIFCGEEESSGEGSNVNTPLPLTSFSRSAKEQRCVKS